MKKNHLITLPIYGIHIQRLLHHILTIQDKKKRTQHTQTLISLIQKMQSKWRNKLPSPAKIWHDLYVMSNYTLDIDTPYPKPEKITLSSPQPIGYNNHPQISQTKQYGYNIHNYILKIAELSDPELQQKLLLRIIKLITKFYKNPNHINTLFAYIQSITNTKLTHHFEPIKNTLKL